MIEADNKWMQQNQSDLTQKEMNKAMRYSPSRSIFTIDIYQE